MGLGSKMILSRGSRGGVMSSLWSTHPATPRPPPVPLEHRRGHRGSGQALSQAAALNCTEGVPGPARPDRHSRRWRRRPWRARRWRLRPRRIGDHAGLPVMTGINHCRGGHVLGREGWFTLASHVLVPESDVSVSCASVSCGGRTCVHAIETSPASRPVHALIPRVVAPR
jgi:hypothetical protein